MIVGENPSLMLSDYVSGKFLWDRHRFASTFHFNRCPIPSVPSKPEFVLLLGRQVPVIRQDSIILAVVIYTSLAAKILLGLFVLMLRRAW
jgi:hypothetical protein